MFCILLLALACGPTSSDLDDSAAVGDDTGLAPPPKFGIVEVLVECSPGDPEVWSYEVRLDRVAVGVTLDILAGQLSEEHSLARIDSGSAGYWDLWGISLPVVADYQDQEDNVNSVFRCEFEDTLTWKLRAWDDFEAYPTCVYWGADVDEYHYSGDGCTVLEPS